MAEGRGADQWDQRSHKGDLPWDSGLVDEELMAMRALTHGPVRALAIGCGTRANAIWLAQQGLETVATDVAAKDIALAQAKPAWPAPRTRGWCAPARPADDRGTQESP